MEQEARREDVVARARERERQVAARRGRGRDVVEERARAGSLEAVLVRLPVQRQRPRLVEVDQRVEGRLEPVRTGPSASCPVKRAGVGGAR